MTAICAQFVAEHEILSQTSEFHPPGGPARRYRWCMETEKERGVERLIFFTDAVVAIAITLLILPLVEIVTTDANLKHPLTIGQFLGDNLSQMFAFALSFAIIARFWMANHEVLVNTMRSTPVLMWLDVAWVFTIVVMPLTTEITAVYHPSPLTVGLYIGTGLVSMVMLTAICYYLYRHPELQAKDEPISGTELWGVGSTAAGFIIAFAISLIFPVVTYYSLLVLLLSGPLDAIVKPRIARAEAARLTT
jgi:uncharacterized membrane protein